MKKNNTFRRAAALMAALSITVSLAVPAFADTYYIDYGDITITKKDDGSQEIKQNGTIIENDCGMAKVQPLWDSLNPVTVYKLGINEDTLPNKKKWRIE